jgi:hypothetical protein
MFLHLYPHQLLELDHLVILPLDYARLHSLLHKINQDNLIHLLTTSAHERLSNHIVNYNKFKSVNQIVERLLESQIKDFERDQEALMTSQTELIRREISMIQTVKSLEELYDLKEIQDKREKLIEKGILTKRAPEPVKIDTASVNEIHSGLGAVDGEDEEDGERSLPEPEPLASQEAAQEVIPSLELDLQTASQVKGVSPLKSTGSKRRKKSSRRSAASSSGVSSRTSRSSISRSESGPNSQTSRSRSSSSSSSRSRSTSRSSSSSEGRGSDGKSTHTSSKTQLLERKSKK